jgi:hypothetical protein
MLDDAGPAPQDAAPDPGDRPRDLPADRFTDLPADLVASVFDDPRMLAAVRATYRGSHDVRDAVWWRMHPLTVGPSGTPDPAIALAALRHDAYSRSGAQAPLVAMVDETSGRTVLVRSSEVALREAQRQQQLDATLLDSAIESVVGVRGESSRREGASREAASRGAAADGAATGLPEIDGIGEDRADAVPAPGTPQAVRVHRKARRPLVAVVAAAAILAVVASAFAAGRMSSPPVAAPTPVVTSSLGPFSGGQHGAATIALLQSPQSPADVPPFAFDSAIIPGSIHVLAAVQSRGATVYGSLTKTGLICLVAVTVDLHSAQTCATRHAFVTDGIRLRLTTNTPVATASGASDFAFFEYFWSSDGSIVGSSNQFFVTECQNCSTR